MQLALELGIAGLIQIDLESAIVIDDEVGDALGEQAHWEAMGAEDFVDGERSRSWWGSEGCEGWEEQRWESYAKMEEHGGGGGGSGGSGYIIGLGLGFNREMGDW